MICRVTHVQGAFMTARKRGSFSLVYTAGDVSVMGKRM